MKGGDFSLRVVVLAASVEVVLVVVAERGTLFFNKKYAMLMKMIMIDR
jgi:hypothetical protein